MKISGDYGVCVEWHSPVVNADGWLESYDLTLRGRQMQATIKVANTPYGESPADFFGTLSMHWQGWQGVKEWASLEGEYQMSAKSDAMGHITLSVRIWSRHSGQFWTSEVALIVEAGYLEQLVRDMRKFIYPAANLD